MMFGVIWITSTVDMVNVHRSKNVLHYSLACLRRLIEIKSSVISSCFWKACFRQAQYYY